MNPRETTDADLRAAVGDRLNTRLEQARQRRENRNRLYAQKNARRTAGLEARHTRKIQRTTSKEN